MKATIEVHLARPTRKGRTVIAHQLIARKDEIINKVQEYILERAQRTGFIPVKIFKVSIKDYKNRVINTWNYSPTYR